MAHHLKNALAAATAAATAVDDSVRETVASVIEDVRQHGDDAVRRCSEKFDGWSPAQFRLSAEQIDDIVSSCDQQVIDDIAFVQQQVRTFAQHQRDAILDIEVETLPGVVLGHRNTPVDAAGAYVPGGRYPLVASSHMTIVTAKVAGVPRVAACTPPIRGEVPAATVAAMSMAGADEIYLLGGVQAVAAMAIGTETIRKVNFIAGPGNAYVAEAKRQLFGAVGIDLVAGPTEVLVLADDSADPLTIAVDLLSQAEHGPDSPAVLITTSRAVGEEVVQLVERILPGLPTRDLAGRSWHDFGQVIVADDMDELWAMADELAYEHVQVFTSQPRDALERMTNYGALFLGDGTCVSYGDKVIGTNHVLPTRGGATYTGGLWVGKYLKTATYQEVTSVSASAELGRLCGRAARVELFEGHARSGDIRAARRGENPAWLEDIGIRVDKLVDR